MVLEGAPPADAVLARELDKLALAYHDTPDGEPADDDGKPPREDYQQRYDRLRSRFPEYGYYPVADPSGTLDQEYVLGDAIDDLADIASDLDETVWRFVHLGPDDAHWHFNSLYQIHWGQHLRELSYYLYAKIRRDLSDS